MYTQRRRTFSLIGHISLGCVVFRLFALEWSLVVLQSISAKAFEGRSRRYRRLMKIPTGIFALKTDLSIVCRNRALLDAQFNFGLLLRSTPGAERLMSAIQCVASSVVLFRSSAPGNTYVICV